MRGVSRERKGENNEKSRGRAGKDSWVGYNHMGLVER